MGKKLKKSARKKKDGVEDMEDLAWLTKKSSMAVAEQILQNPRAVTLKNAVQVFDESPEPISSAQNNSKAAGIVGNEAFDICDSSFFVGPVTVIFQNFICSKFLWQRCCGLLRVSIYYFDVIFHGVVHNRVSNSMTPSDLTAFRICERIP